MLRYYLPKIKQNLFLRVSERIKATEKKSEAKLLYPFSAWFPLKGHTHLKAAGLFKFVWHVSGHHAIKSSINGNYGQGG